MFCLCSQKSSLLVHSKAIQNMTIRNQLQKISGLISYIIGKLKK